MHMFQEKLHGMENGIADIQSGTQIPDLVPLSPDWPWDISGSEVTTGLDKQIRITQEKAEIWSAIIPGSVCYPTVSDCSGFHNPGFQDSLWYDPDWIPAIGATVIWILYRNTGYSGREWVGERKEAIRSNGYVP